MRLGRDKVSMHKCGLRITPYLAGLPTPPDNVNWSGAVQDRWTMLCNDVLGDCTIAGPLHMEQCWAANAGGLFVPTDDMAREAYQRIDGWVPGDSTTDNGGDVFNVETAWKNDGIGGRKIAGFASANPQDGVEIKQCIAIFGGMNLGITLPVSSQTQDIWDVVDNDGGVWGGHDVPIVDYTKDLICCITWGMRKYMTWAFFFKYCDEASPCVSPDFIRKTGTAPSGFGLPQLESDLALVH